MVGLPARGKSFIVQKLARYLNWLQHQTRIFNAGELRRKFARTTSMGYKPEDSSSQSLADFFDPRNRENVSRRDEIALSALDELLDWIVLDSRSVGILDATNSTTERRRLVLERIRARVGTKLPVVFLESCCFDQEILERNFRLKLRGPDYKSQNPEKALQDFRRRVALYEQSYTPLGQVEEDEDVSYVQVIDVGRKMNTHMIQGFLSTQVVEYMLGFNLTERQLWMSCSGESMDDAVGRIGRQSALSNDGKQYANALAQLVQQHNQIWTEARPSRSPASCPSDFCIWTSTMPQATQTALSFSTGQYTTMEMKILDDLNAGDMAGLTFREIEERHPDVYATRKRHKLLYRWPGLGGEAYGDVIHRLKPLIVELERMREHLLVITHRAVVRVLLAYFLDLQRTDLPEMVIPKNWAFLLEPVRDNPLCISMESCSC